MVVIDEGRLSQIGEKLKEMTNPVTAIIFTAEDGCEYCKDAENLLKEIQSVAPKLIVKSYLLSKNAAEAKKYRIEKTPAIILENGSSKIGLLRYFGLPAGYEKSTFLSDLIDLSRGEPKISSSLKEQVRSISFPVHIQVFVTPQCPYCPPAVKLAHDFAMLNPNVTGDMVEVTEFPDLSEKYNVMGVPKTVINETLELEGAYPIDVVIKKILELKP